MSMSASLREFPDRPVVEYDTCRRDIRDGDLLFCSGSAPMSKMIQWATMSCWSHVALLMWVESIDRLVVLESVESIGVRSVPLRSYLTDYNGSGEGYPGRVVIARHGAMAQNSTASARARLGQFAVDRLGYPYNSQQIALIAARIMGGLFLKKPKDTLLPEDSRAFICSEYVWHAYKELGLAIQPNERGYVAPSDLAADPNMAAQWVLR